MLLKMKLISILRPFLMSSMHNIDTDRAPKIKAKLFAIRVPNGPRQANLVLIAYASSEGSGETAHPRSLARTFAARSYKQ